MRSIIIALSGLIMALMLTVSAQAENLVLTLKDGNVVINLRSDVAPRHAERLKTLTENGEYNNVAFHRVIPGFMAQTGDVQFGDLEDGYGAGMPGTGGSSLGNLPAEFSNVSFERGIVGMARAQDPNSANSQFFIMFAPAPHLNGQYTVVGEVVSGMEIVDQIKVGAGRNGAVQEPDRIISARITQ